MKHVLEGKTLEGSISLNQIKMRQLQPVKTFEVKFGG